MKIKQREVYLVDFGKRYNSEFGKIRPAVVMQTDFLNYAIDMQKYKSVLIVPLSSSKIGNDYRLRIPARDKLEKESFCVANWICTVDIERVKFDKGILTVLSDQEFAALREKVCSLI